MVLDKEKKWYEYDNNDRVKNVYSKYTIKQFWDWWSDNDNEFMEVRIKDFIAIKEYSINNYIPMSKSGLYVNDYEKLDKVIKHFGQEKVMWFSINPKRRLINKNGYKKFSGMDININKIKHLFIDIDRIKKENVATKEDLMSADILANYVIKEFAQAGFANNYCKICSGNGLQLLFKLDNPIIVPIPKYDEKLGQYMEDNFFIEIKDIFKKGIKGILQNYSNSFRDKFNIEIDTTSFNIGRVGALPFTYNHKYKTSLPRGIVELVNKGNNDGLSDYLRSLKDDVSFKDNERRKFSKKTEIEITQDYKINKNEMYKNSLINLMMNYKFPCGGINNTLWYAIKILFHMNNINKNEKEYVKIREMLKKIHNRDFSDNGLEPKNIGNYKGPIKEDNVGMIPFMVNKYLRNNKIKRINDGLVGYHKPLFDVSPNGKIEKKVKINMNNLDITKKVNYEYELNNEKNDPLKDISYFAKYLDNVRDGLFLNNDMIKNGIITNIGKMFNKIHLDNLFLLFLKKYRRKWGDELTFYMYKFYMEDYFNYKRF